MKASYTKIAAFAKTTGMDTASSLELANRAMVAVADSAAFYDRSLEETTESLQSFLKGNYENDAALGLSATETTRNAAANRLYGKSFIELSESQKQFTLLQMVEDANKLSGALGQSARESDTYTNQVGNLNQAWKNLSATIGRIILPQAIETTKRIATIVNTINALITKIAEALGWLKPFNELFGKSKNASSAGDSVAASMENAAKSTKKAKKAAEGYLSPLDEINKIKKEDSSDNNDSSGTGVSGASVSVPEIDYGNIENSGQEIADKIAEKFSGAFDTLKEAWESKGKSVVSSAKSAFEGIKSVVESVWQTWKQLWQDGTILTFLESVLDVFKTIFDIIASIAIEFASAWTSGDGFENVKAFFDMFTDINGLLVSIGQSFSTVFSNGTGTEIWSNILGIITGVYKIIGNIAEGITEAWNEAGLGDSIMQGILDIFNIILETIHNIIDSTAEWAEKLDFTPLLQSIDGLLKALKPLAKNIGEGLEWFWNNVLLPIAGWTIQEAVPAFLDMLSAAINVLNETINALKPLGQWLWDEFLKPLGEWAGDTIIAAMETVTNLLNKFAGWISEHQETVQAFVAIIGTLGAGFVTLSQGIPLVTTVLGGLSTAIGVLTSPIGLVVAAVVGLIAALSDLWATSDTFKKSVVGAFEKVKKSLVNAFNKVKGAITPLIKSIGDLVSSFIEFYENSPIKSIVALIASLAATLAGNVISIAIDMISSAFSNFTKILNGAIEIITGVFDILTALFTLDFEKFKEGLGKIKDGLLDAFSGSIGNITMIGTDLIGGLLKGMLDVMSTIGSWIEEHIFSPIVDWFKKLFGIHSPSTVMAEQGDFIMEGLLKGLKDTVGSVLSWFGKLPETIKDKLGNAKDWLVEKGKNAIEGLRNGWEAVKEGKIGQTVSQIGSYVKQKAGDAKTWIEQKGKDAIDGLKSGWEAVKESKFLSNVGKISEETFSKIGNIKDKVKSKGKDIISGINKGLNDDWPTLSNWFGNLGTKIKNALPKNLFSQFADVGKNIIGGIKKGITGAASTVKKAVNKVSGGIVDDFEYDMDINSPSKVMEKEGEYVVAGLIEGLGNVNDITDWSDEISEELQNSMSNPESWVSSDGLKNISDSIKETMSETMEEVKETWNNTWEELGETAESVSDSVRETIETTLGEASEAANSSLGEIGQAVSETVENVTEETSNAADNIVSSIGQMSDDTINNFNSVTESIKDGITLALSEIENSWNESWRNLEQTVSIVFERITDRISSAIDNILIRFEDMANNAVNSFTAISDALNSLQSGGMAFDISIPKLNKMPIPHLATGTVVPQNREFLSVLGDNKNEPEIVSPISTMKQAFMEAIAEAGGLNTGGNGTIVIKQYLDGKQVAEAVVKQGKLQQMSSGNNMFMLGGA